MSLRIKWIFICVTIKIVISYAKESPTPITIKVDAEQIVDTFKSLMFSQFIQEMANEIANKAAEKFINQVKTKQKDLLVEQHLQRVQPFEETTTTKMIPDINLLPENDAFVLLREPSPDGDEIELDSLESLPTKAVPVVGKNRINGVYFRRLLRVPLT